MREALRKLQARDLIEVVPNKGATVSVPSRTELIDAYDVRSELEGYACELAAPRVTEDTIQKLDKAHDRIKDLVAGLQGGRKENRELAWVHMQLNKANDDFHHVIHGTAGNSRLTQLIGDLATVFPRDYFWRGMRSGVETQLLNLDEHQRIRDAIATRNANAGRTAMQDHVLHARNVLLRYLDKRGFWR